MRRSVILPVLNWGVNGEEAGFSIINQIDAPESEAYLKAFDLLWNDQQRLQDMTDKVLDSIAAAYQENSPEFLCFFCDVQYFPGFFGASQSG